MSQKFKAVVIDNQNEKFTREIKEIDTSHLKDGNVLVKIDYSSLNYKDALILNNGGKIVRKFPFVPGIDFSGTVVESEDNKFKKDDKVILTGFRVGEAFFGGFAQYAKVDANFLIVQFDGFRAPDVLLLRLRTMIAPSTRTMSMNWAFVSVCLMR